MSEATAAARGSDQAVLLEEAARRAHGRPLPFRLVPGQKGQEFFRAPGRMMATRLEQGANNLSRRAVGAMKGPAGSFGEPFEALLLESVDPLVAGLAADVVAAAYFGYRVESSGAVGDEQEFLVHG